MHKFLRLPWFDQARVLEALAFVLAARTFLLLIPFRKTVAVAAYLSERLPARHAGDIAPLARLSYLVQRVSEHVPGATCLTQALALRLMLMRRRVACHLRIGVAKDPSGTFKAHAWLETLSHQVIIGGTQSPRQYKPLKFNLEKAT